MKNKVLIKLMVPEIDFSYDIFIPANEIIWKIKKMIVKSIGDLQRTEIDVNGEYLLINKCTGKIYDNNELVIDTDIRNATELVLVSVIKM